MALATNTYGTVADVQRFVRDLPDGAEFSESTTPTLQDVEIFLDHVSDQLNEALRASGYTVPVASTGDDIQANGRLALCASMGAAAMLLGTFPSEAFNPDNPDAKNRMDYFQMFLDKVLEDIRGRDLGATRSSSSLSRIFSGSQEDKDGKEKKPVFTRDVTDYPGARSLLGS